ncbi:MAG: hypothetical protein WCT26_04415 [Candidatus Buchananbacteria bacterium]
MSRQQKIFTHGEKLEFWRDSRPWRTGKNSFPPKPPVISCPLDLRHGLGISGFRFMDF